MMWKQETIRKLMIIVGTSNRELNLERYKGNVKITSTARGNDLLL
jgi:hypothetical protein